ncbi:ead/Ea22-like family protein [Enterobacter hormaechei]|uniref:ead/Ea22-like family protein n=1 Tax=Enterobacter hormaechei TaxID=158836 RepID=UPI0005EF5CA4|nr:ead/Ea22-like family protein [Enterobacter hormaechei]KJM73094.1 hypothetical protein SS28_12530 [Enterobacter hormaechei subsp. steigerwaltii]
MSNIDKQALREVAEKATPGPWLWINTGSYFSFLVPQSNQDPHNCIIDDGSSWGEYGETINPESPDGVFIAAANPAAVLALLDELEAEQRISSTWRKTAESNREKLEAAERRIAKLSASHGKLREAMAGIHNIIRGEGAYTPLAAILNASKRAYEESAAAAGKGE